MKKRKKIGLFYLFHQFPSLTFFHYLLAFINAYVLTETVFKWIDSVLTQSKDITIAARDNIWPFVGRVVFYGIVVYFHTTIGEYCEELYSFHLRKQLTRKYLATSFSQTQNKKTISIEFANDTNSVGKFAARIYNDIFLALVIMAFLLSQFWQDKPDSTGKIIRLRWVVPYILTAALISVVIAITLSRFSFYYFSRSNQASHQENKYFNDIKSNIERIKATGSENREIQKSNEVISVSRKAKYSWILTKNLSTIISDYLLARLIPLAFLLRSEGLPGIVLYGRLNEFFEKLKKIIGWFWAQGDYDIYCSKLKKLDLVFWIFEEDKKTKYSSNIQSIKKIVFDNVTFTYPETKQKILSNFTFTFQAGKKYAIIGPNGSGKSTLFKLLLQLYQPQEGVIKIGERSLMEVNSSFLNRWIFYSRNRPFFFQSSLGENVMYPDKYDSDEKREKLNFIAKELELDSLISRLPHQWETIIKNNSLSTGQKQLVDLIRLFAREYEIYLFDEALSNVNTKLKKRVLNTIFEKMKNKTVIFITHDLSILNYVDEVYEISSTGLAKR